MRERKTECYAPESYKKLSKITNYKDLEVFKTQSNFLIGSYANKGYVKKTRWVGIDKNNQRTCFYTTKKEVIAEIDGFLVA